jgi:transposase-like protein
LDRKYRRRQILAARDERAEELDQLLVGRDPKEVFNKDGLFDELKKALAERVLNAEIDDHLDNEAGEGRKNHLSSRRELGARTCNARSASGSAAAGTW